MRDHGHAMVNDLLTVESPNRALRSWAAHINKWAELGLEVAVDEDFETLFGDEDHGRDWKIAQEERCKQLEAYVLLQLRHRFSRDCS